MSRFQKLVTWAYCKYVVKPAIDDYLNKGLLDQTAYFVAEHLGEEVEIEFIPDDGMGQRLH